MLSRIKPHAAALVAAFVGMLVLAASQIPHAQGLRSSRHAGTTGRVYAGYPPTYADEATAYLHWMRQAHEGRFLFADRLTPEPSERRYVNVLFWSMGTVARITGLPDVAIYSAARVVFGAALIALLWVLAGRFFERPWERLACFLPLVVAGGWEGPANFLERNFGGPHVSSPQWWSPQMSTFYSLMTLPHLLAVLLVTGGVVLLLLRAWTRDGVPRRERDLLALAAGLLMALLTLSHPFDDLTLPAMLWIGPALLSLGERRLDRGAFRVAAIATLVWLPALAYDTYAFRSSTALRSWDLQNAGTTLPAPGRLAIAFGVSGVLAAVALARPKRLSRPQIVAAAWLAAALLLAYFPYRFQRGMLGGVQLPLAILGTAGLALVARRYLLPVTLALLPLQAATPYYLFDIEWRGVRAERYPAWLETAQVEGMRFLERTAAPDSVVLASWEMGNVLPSRAPVRVVGGHDALTTNAAEKKEAIRRFFAAETEEAWRLEALERWRVEYLFHSAHERALGEFDPGAVPWLSEAFAAGGVRVYRVRTSGPGSP